MQIKELGHVVLYVSNLETSANFYKDTLGFYELDRGNGFALFSGGRTHHEMLLIEVGGQPNNPDVVKPGLYHIGFKVGDSPEDLKAVYKELKEKGVSITGTTDHYVTHSLYILDPDNNQLELYADVTDEWKTNPLAVLNPPKRLNLE